MYNISDIVIFFEEHKDINRIDVNIDNDKLKIVAYRVGKIIRIDITTII